MPEAKIDHLWTDTQSPTGVRGRKYRTGVIGNLYPKDEPFTRRAAREYVGGSLRGVGVLDLREGKVVAGIPAREILLGEALKTGGYRTAMVGKWHLGDYSIDLYPTILSLAGVPLPEDRVIDGRDVLGLLTGRETRSPHEALFFYHYDQLEGVRSGQWKYFRRINRYVWPIPLDAAPVPDRLGGSQLGNRWPLLYNLAIDPGENYNVIDTHPDVADGLEAILQAWESETAPNPGGWR